jgi:pimeloyl-ACP methyl ester carboxylesterase
VDLGRQVVCPVVALHGDGDPHPAAGVREPLTGVLKDFQFILLRDCGHTPWIERRAKEAFYDILRAQLH